MPTEEWSKIPGFSLYSVSSYGRIRNDVSDRILELNQNQTGVLHVGLWRNDKQHHRSVPLMVARAFVEKPYPQFDTPINLNGDRTDCRVENLAWRPRWFAVKYNQQFLVNRDPVIPNRIRNTKTGEISDNSWDCAIRYGLIEEDLAMSIFNNTYTWPLYVMFKAISEE